MSSNLADRDDSLAEAQDQDTAENESNSVGMEQDSHSSTGAGPVETEGEAAPEMVASTGDGEDEDGAGIEPGPAAAEGSAASQDAVLVEAEEPAASGSDPDVTAEGEATSDASPAAAVEGEPASGPEPDLDGGKEAEEEEKRRRRLILLLVALLLALFCACATLWRYVNRPAPLPDLLPVPLNVNYPPHYLFSIIAMDKPVGVALSPQGDRIYVTETSGERQVKMFDRDGNPLGSFAPPRTAPGERSPVYLATDSTGRVYVTDRLQHAVFVYEREGQYLDSILSPDLTLSEHVSNHVGGLRIGDKFAYNPYEAGVHYQHSGEEGQILPAPNPSAWSPLGIRVDGRDNVLLTDVSTAQNVVRDIPADVFQAGSWRDFEPPQRVFGETGQLDGQLLFPNSAVRDSRGRIHVTDGNNGRISVWDAQGQFLFNLGRGAGEGGLNLPRGAAIDERDRLHVVDAVGQNVKVYDVSGKEPDFLFSFGDMGLGDGQFNYPNDIALDASGRLYIADRENSRVQVWSY